MTIMACSSARAFSQSLLEARGGGECDAPTPSTAEVVVRCGMSLLALSGVAFLSFFGLKKSKGATLAKERSAHPEPNIALPRGLGS